MNYNYVAIYETAKSHYIYIGPSEDAQHLRL